jgi:AcrR family transcriptional regulator
MKEVKRMNEHRPTANALIEAARRLFSQYGYDRTSVRAVTRLAGANIGAITYHFGSKEALYEAVIGSVMAPFAERLAETAASPGTPLERIDRVLRVFFEFLHDNPDLPPLFLQQVVSGRPIPEVALRAIRSNMETVAALISQGQSDGSIRAGDPRLMALSIAAQPIWLALAGRVLQEGVSIDSERPETRARVVESVAAFVRAGLCAHEEDAL